MNNTPNKPIAMENWCSEKPYLVRIIAHMLALSTYETYDSLVSAKTNTTPDGFNQPQIKEWLSYYEGGNTVVDLSRVFHNFGGPSSLGSHIHLQMLGLQPEVPKEFQGLSDLEIFNKHIQSIKDDIAKAPLTKEETTFAHEKIVTTQFLFHMKVALPCQLIISEDHITLFDKATKGDVQALNDLLRLDKNIIQHNKINKWFTHYSQEKNSYNFDRLSDAIGKPINAQITIEKVKVLLAGTISILSEGLGHRLSAPQIRALFNAIAIDYGRDKLIDTDLPDSEEAFSTAIKRHRQAMFSRITAATPNL